MVTNPRKDMAARPGADDEEEETVAAEVTVALVTPVNPDAACRFVRKVVPVM